MLPFKSFRSSPSAIHEAVGRQNPGCPKVAVATHDPQIIMTQARASHELLPRQTESVVLLWATPSHSLVEGWCHLEQQPRKQYGPAPCACEHRLVGRRCRCDELSGGLSLPPHTDTSNRERTG